SQPARPDCERGPWVLFPAAPEPMRRRRAEESLADAAKTLAAPQWRQELRSPRAKESRNWEISPFSSLGHLPSAVAASLSGALPVTWPPESRAPARGERPGEKVSPLPSSRARRSLLGGMALLVPQRVQVSGVPRCQQPSISALDRVSRHAAQYPETAEEG